MRKFPAIEPKQYTGNENIIDSEGQPFSSLIGFWRWAYSDLVGNTERGGIAEYLVACALGIDKDPRISWDLYDLKSREEIRIEVKASGYLQTWQQNKLSSISFGIQKTHAWNRITNEYQVEIKRQTGGCLCFLCSQAYLSGHHKPAGCSSMGFLYSAYKSIR